MNFSHDLLPLHNLFVLQNNHKCITYLKHEVGREFVVDNKADWIKRTQYVCIIQKYESKRCEKNHFALFLRN